MFSHQSSDSEGFTALRRHEEYYLTGGDLFFLIEQNHFRVHRYFFERESQFFKRELATPASPGATRQGTSESTAIVLDSSVKASSFAKFLWVFYNPKYSLYKARVEDWVAIMELAHRWGFHEVMKLATREIEKLEMPDIDRIVAYHKFELDRSLLLHRYAALTAREDPLNLEEGMALGMDTTLKIFRAREIARATPAADGSRSPTSATLPDDEMQGLIVDLFEIPDQSRFYQENSGDSLSRTNCPGRTTCATCAPG
ncbi:hypothetical protein EV368DRAFT_73606 [Lentinula lateritia]|uniref:Uncharacterized protein n=1 Tax=Lentinula aff. lateritia TaxID=2804960 RepID=A0ACC1U2W4_9AGAR|nr:hypothetical protein F5876DRAFT_88371 [Lentinula aff. lateritia]KAJ3853191.1 hypothetical protein EV368DRAFT_73606 [Lentinula lateritia]